MKKETLKTDNIANDIYTSKETIRKFKFAFPGTPEKNVKDYRKAKKMVARLLTHKNNVK
jgi:hypothetical protein